MADKIKCSECKYCKLYHSRYGNRQRCCCDHPDQEYIMQYFLIVISDPCPVLLVIPGGVIVLFLANILPVGVPGREAV